MPGGYIVRCPRDCGGTLLQDANERNLLTCILCAHGFMYQAGELVQLLTRDPTIEESRQLKRLDRSATPRLSRY